MAQQVSFPMNVPASVAAGTAFDARSMRGRLVQLFGTFVATVSVEGSLNGTDWIIIGTALTASGYRVVEDGWSFVRCNTTAFTSGTPAARIGGMV